MSFVITNARIFTGQMWLTPGFVRVEQGVITSVGVGAPLPSSIPNIDAAGLTVFPGIIDCHSHLLEFGSFSAAKALGKAQRAAGYANLLKAAQAGITTLGEHMLGHPFLNQPLSVYREIIAHAPQTVLLACGWCTVGTEPLTLLSAHKPGQKVIQQELDDQVLAWLAKNSEFPGENIFVTATPANLPPHQVPRAGESILNHRQLQKTIDIFHAEGRRIGAHLEGELPTRIFLELGGDVVHHGHGISDETLSLMARCMCDWIITPHGGTGTKPTPARQIALALELGLKPALASDSYLPIHLEAHSLAQGLPQQSEVGPGEFMQVINNLCAELTPLGVSSEEVMRMLTLYPAQVLGIHGVTGSIEPGKRADLVIARGLWGVEITSPGEIVQVFSQGQLIIDNS